MLHARSSSRSMSGPFRRVLDCGLGHFLRDEALGNFGTLGIAGMVVRRSESWYRTYPNVSLPKPFACAWLRCVLRLSDASGLSQPGR